MIEEPCIQRQADLGGINEHRYWSNSHRSVRGKSWDMRAFEQVRTTDRNNHPIICMLTSDSSCCREAEYERDPPAAIQRTPSLLYDDTLAAVDEPGVRAWVHVIRPPQPIEQ